MVHFYMISGCLYFVLSKKVGISAVCGVLFYSISRLIMTCFNKFKTYQ